MTRHRAIVWCLRGGLVAAVLGAWMYASGPGGVSNLVLPKVGRVFTDLRGLLTTRQTWDDAQVTLAEIFAAFAIAALAAFVVALWAARSPLRASVTETFLAWGFMAPLVLFYPIFILWAGIGVASKISFAVASAFFPIAYNVLRGLTSVDDRYLRVGRAFGASSIQTDVSIKMWAAMPLIAAGVRIGAAMAIITTVLAEMLASTRGLGYALTTASDTFQTSQMFAMILIIVGVVGILQLVIQLVLSRFDWSAARV